MINHFAGLQRREQPGVFLCLYVPAQNVICPIQNLIFPVSGLFSFAFKD